MITEAYQRLAEDGHVAGRGQAGTIVAAAPVAAQTAGPPPTPASPPTSALFAAAPDADVFDTLRAAPARIDLSPDVPDHPPKRGTRSSAGLPRLRLWVTAYNDRTIRFYTRYGFKSTRPGPPHS